ncbi:hypothetical protein NDU88_004665 [Pleurodeles waltl]|uniref:nucleoside-diphosphate kinase n=1 Tax=Pleurodeles waltl TaxID=8319 RepID=A0AAV7MVK2_PLEWA|nr:hypothetical protein NDU88_004665 [Pleurodeles waltl]
MFWLDPALTRLCGYEVVVTVARCDCKNMSGNGIRERTFICIKPDAVQRGLVGEIIKRFEQKGYRMVAMKFMQASDELLKEHYIDLKDRPFYSSLV